jgi:hypothetical protein
MTPCFPVNAHRGDFAERLPELIVVEEHDERVKPASLLLPGAVRFFKSWKS